MQNVRAVDGVQSKGLITVCTHPFINMLTCMLFYPVKIDYFGCSSYSKTLFLPVQIAEIVTTIASVQRGKGCISEFFNA